MPRRLLTLVVLLLLAAAGVGGWRGALPDERDASPGGPYTATVDHVVDGDTLVVRHDGRRVTVRLVQIDAPESSSTRYGAPDACGPAATRFAERLVAPGARVRIEPAGADATDRYGRTLAIVALPGGSLWQVRMARAGWAEPYVFEGNRTRVLGPVRRAAAVARRRDAGVWGRCGGRFHTAA